MSTIQLLDIETEDWANFIGWAGSKLHRNNSLDRLEKNVW